MISDVFALGAVQLGMNYGVANTTGKPNNEMANEILSTAWKLGVRWIDTAASYGDSEDRIGEFSKQFPEKSFSIVTKLAGSVNHLEFDSVRESVVQSTKRIGKNPTAILLHDPTALQYWDQGLGKSLSAMKAQGLVYGIGVSIYAPSEFLEAMNIDEIDFIQAPFSVFDQRLLQADFIKKAVLRKKKVFFRSIFLQGLLLMNPNRAAVKFGSNGFHVQKVLSEWHQMCSAWDRSPIEVALGFARAVAPDVKLVLGCDSSEQVEKNVELLKRVELFKLTNEQIIALQGFSELPPALYDPRLWQTHG